MDVERWVDLDEQRNMDGQMDRRMNRWSNGQKRTDGVPYVLMIFNTILDKRAMQDLMQYLTFVCNKQKNPLPLDS